MVLVFPGDRIRLLSSSSPEGKDGEEDFEEEGEIECGSGAYRDENGIKRASKIGEIYVKDVFEDDVLAVDEEDEDEENDEEEKKKKKTKKKRKRVVEVLNREEIEDENVRVRLPEVNDVVFAKVVRAKCKRCKTTMVAMNWQEMMCPKTEHREMRKVAKIDEIKDM